MSWPVNQTKNELTLNKHNELREICPMESTCYSQLPHVHPHIWVSLFERAAEKLGHISPTSKILTQPIQATFWLDKIWQNIRDNQSNQASLKFLKILIVLDFLEPEQMRSCFGQHQILSNTGESVFISYITLF